MCIEFRYVQIIYLNIAEIPLYFSFQNIAV